MNTPGGGALLVGIDDATGARLGTALDEEWLQRRIYERVDVAPAIEPREVEGIRLLVIYVAEAREPVEGIDGKLRWRVGKHCAPVDRAEWWLRRQDNAGHDAMAIITDRTLHDVSPRALEVAQRYLRLSADIGEGLAETSDGALLSRLGVLRPDGRLTQAGALTFCPSERTYLALTLLDVEGGDVLVAPVDLAGQSLLEQVAAIEARLDAFNTAVTVRGTFAEEPVRSSPQRRSAKLCSTASRTATGCGLILC